MWRWHLIDGLADDIMQEIWCKIDVTIGCIGVMAVTLSVPESYLSIQTETDEHAIQNFQCRKADSFEFCYCNNSARTCLDGFGF